MTVRVRRFWKYFGAVALAFAAVVSIGFFPDRNGQAYIYVFAKRIAPEWVAEKQSAWATERQIRESYKLWAVDRTASELQREMERKNIPVTYCNASSKKQDIYVCLKMMGPTSKPFGSVVKLKLKWSGLPPEAFIRIKVRSAAPAGQRYRYAGPVGAITNQPFGGTSEGEADIVWDGKSSRCAPTDLPIMCDEGEIGKFALTADVYTGDDPGHVGWPPIKPVPTKILATSEPVLLTFDGMPRSLASRNQIFERSDTERQVREALSKSVPKGGYGTHQYWAEQFKRFGPWRESWFSYCSDVDLAWPYVGTLSACFPKSRRDKYGIAIEPFDVTVHGRARLVHGFMPAKEAAQLAKQEALSLIQGNYDFDHYPKDSELKTFIPPELRDLNDPDSPAAPFDPDLDIKEKYWKSRIRWVNQLQSQADLIQFGASSFWLVTVEQRIEDLNQQIVKDSLLFIYRVEHNGKACLLLSRNRSEEQRSTKTPMKFLDRSKQENMLCPSLKS
jgi:hypothetical protein